MTEPVEIINLCDDSPVKCGAFQFKVAHGLNSPTKANSPSKANSPCKPDTPTKLDIPLKTYSPVQSRARAPLPIESEPEIEKLPPSVNYTISGTPLCFPCKPYPSQVAIMAKVIKGLQEAQNCLLESPTGTGKTLALLCSSLAWQKVEKEKIESQKLEYLKDRQEKELQLLGQYNQTPLCTCQKKEEEIRKIVEANENEQPKVPEATPASQSEDACSSDEDFKPTRKKQKGVAFKEVCVCTCGAWQRQQMAINAKADGQAQVPIDENVPTFSVPKIFYGTRTHKQITQVVRELKKTVYRNVKMTILGSREHSCIHPLIKGCHSKTELCHELLDARKGAGCMFKTNGEMYMSSHSQLEQYHCPEPFDIEDLVDIGIKIKCCPYFSARALMKSAELIFCPYNYLIDLSILESTQVKLEGNIVILDEAHNIEDVARESASYSVERHALKKAAEDCRTVAAVGRQKEHHQFLEDFLVRLVAWIDEQEDKLRTTEEYNKSSYSISGLDAIASFSLSLLGPDVFPYYKSALGNVIADMQASSSKRDKQDLHMISALTKMLLQGLERVLGNLYVEDSSHVDFQVAIIKEMNRQPGAPTTSSFGWHGRSNAGADSQSGFTLTLHFWCQNPAVTMRYMREATRSIILTSGTLAPVDSFSSELGIKFPIQFEANHVIGRTQAFIATTMNGPSGQSLNAQYKNADTYAFQDELGAVILDTCSIVPHGVLCFLPSYKLLEKLTDRWERTGLWDKLLAVKNVFSEPRKATELEHVMLGFRRSIEDPNYANVGGPRTLNGAVLFAVHRGKVSEGIDFADNQARAIIAVGIPYPNFKDTRVELKRQYNDKHCRSRGLLTGSRWYDIQAYRALNQALGRCIRHMNDWGAIILVDDRFSKGASYTNGLSKWIRNMLQTHNSYQSLRNGLTGFTADRISLMQIEAEEETNN